MDIEGDDDGDENPPTQAEVCCRIHGLAATLWRCQLEMHIQGQLAEASVLQERFDELKNWIEREQLTSSFSATELELHRLAFGGWTESQVFETIWRFEALVVLLWATGHFDEMPSWFETVDGRRLLEKAQLMGERSSLDSTSRLRSEDDIEQVQEAAEFWHWRCRTEMMRREGMPAPPGDSYEATIGRALDFAVNDGIVSETVDGDVGVKGVAYAKLPQEEWASIASISIERHYASNWLSGRAPGNDWDRTPTDT